MSTTYATSNASNGAYKPDAKPNLQTALGFLRQVLVFLGCRPRAKTLWSTFACSMCFLEGVLALTPLSAGKGIDACRVRHIFGRSYAVPRQEVSAVPRPLSVLSGLKRVSASALMRKASSRWSSRC